MNNVVQADFSAFQHGNLDTTGLALMSDAEIDEVNGGALFPVGVLAGAAYVALGLTGIGLVGVGIGLGIAYYQYG